MSRFTTLFVFSVALLLICSCSNDEPLQPNNQIESESSKGTIVFKVTWPSKGYVAKIADIEAVSSITAYVNVEPGGTEITHTDLLHEGNRSKAEISVEAGNNYQVVLVAFEDSIIKYIDSDDDVDVVAGGTTTVELSWIEAAPTLNIESTGDNAYSFAWSASSFATSYTLEEDDNNSFSSPNIVYSGSDLTASFSENIGGKYYYRVSIVTPYGNTLWSEIKTVEVGSNDTITIDILWPDEEYVELTLFDQLSSYGSDITGEVINSGNADATNISLTLIARNASGIYLGEKTTSMGTIEAGGRKGFSSKFTEGARSDCEYLDYTLTCDEGGPFTGSVTVE